MPITTTSIDDQMRILMRGVEYGDANIRRTMEDELRARLAEGRALRVYAGFDPTAVDLHLGHLVPMFKMRQFQQLGHEVTFLIGTMTAIVGDPTDRNAARQMQTPEQVEENSKTWLRQAYRVLHPQKTVVKRNGDWLAPMNLADVVEMASNFTVQQFLDHDTFRKRIDSQRPIYLHEFVYALLQGYDAVAMNTDVQIGGTEQLFNIMAGRTLQRWKDQKPQIAVCLPILIGTDGHLRMSKSTGNYISLDDGPAEMFGKVMSIPDALVHHYFTLLTDVGTDDLAKIADQLRHGGGTAMDLKKRLASEIVGLLNDAPAAAEAQAEFERVFQRREDPEESAVELPLDLGASREAEVDITQVLSQAGIISSRGEARRLLAQGALSVDGAVLREAKLTIREGALVRVGRHRFLRVVKGG